MTDNTATRSLAEHLQACFALPWTLARTLYEDEQGRGTGVYEIQSETESGAERSALKCVRVPAAKRAKALREAGLMRYLSDCENIVTIHEYVAVEEGDDVLLLLRMELLVSLDALLESGELPDTPSDAEIARIGADICNALAFCHAEKIAHRDVKPQNIFRSEAGAFKLGDFGISRMFQEYVNLSNTVKSEYTPLYAAPEVLAAQDADYRLADLYSLGLVLYKLGNRSVLPFGPSGLGDLLARRRAGEEPPLAAHCGKPLASIAAKALRFDPKERYPDAQAMLHDLRTVLEGEGKNSALAEQLWREGDALYARQEYGAAYEHFIEAYEGGYERAAYSLGLCMYHGNGTEQGTDGAVELLLPYADLGDTEACYLCGLYFYSQSVAKKDYARAVRYFQVAAAKGHADAQFRLGYCFRKGYSIEKDDAQAEKWFRLAAAQGHIGAQSYIQHEQFWGIYDWMETEGGKSVRLTRVKYIDPQGCALIPEEIDGKPVTALAEYLFLEKPPEHTAQEKRASLLTTSNGEVRQLFLPSSVRTVERGAFYGCVNLQEILLSPASEHLCMREGALYTADGKTLLLYPACSDAEKFTVAPGTVEIADYAFLCCGTLRAVELPGSLRRIGDMAFAGCHSLARIALPEGLEGLGVEAFAFCDKLTRLGIPDSVRRIGQHLLSRRFSPVILCSEKSYAAAYAGEYCIPYRNPGPDEASPREPTDSLSDEVQQLLMGGLLALTVAYERHPEGVPKSSGSYRIVMSAGQEVYEGGGAPLLHALISLFTDRYPQHVKELTAYWARFRS